MLLRFRRDFRDNDGFSTRNQLNAASGSVAKAAMTASTTGFTLPSPQMTSNCCIGKAFSAFLRFVTGAGSLVGPLLQLVAGSDAALCDASTARSALG